MCNNRRLSSGVSVLVISAVLNGIHDNKQDERISDLEKKGEVTVTLGDSEPLVKPIESTNQVTSEVKLPSLYNNHTRIIFHSKKEFMCLSKNIYFESRGEGLIGKIGVAQTTFNRAETGKWGYSFCDVVNAPKQFSWTNTKQKPPKGPEWKASISAAKLFVNGVRVSNLENVKHYHAEYVSPYWNSDMQKKAHIGNHIFYASK